MRRGVVAVTDSGLLGTCAVCGKFIAYPKGTRMPTATFDKMLKAFIKKHNKQCVKGDLRK